MVLCSILEKYRDKTLRIICIKDIRVPPVVIKLPVPHSLNLGENCPEAGLWLVLSDEIWSL